MSELGTKMPFALESRLLILLIAGSCFAHTEKQLNYNLSCWMDQLPSALQKVPLTSLAIPGSHDSASYSITKTSPFSPDLNDVEKGLFSSMDIAVAKDLLYRWSLTQALDIREQLLSGIRYLDMRVSFNISDGEFYVVHGLTGVKLNVVLQQVKWFVMKFPREVILLDFNHVHSRNGSGTLLLYKKIKRYLGDHLCQRRSLHDITLQFMWNIKKQILLFIISESYGYSWNSVTSISAPFHRTEFQESKKWMEFLTRNYERRRPNDYFYVTQGILQPHWLEILAGQTVNASLRTWLANVANPALVQWLGKRKGGMNGINIVIADFVDTHKYIPTVISLNNNDTLSPCKTLHLIFVPMIWLYYYTK